MLPPPPTYHRSLVLARLFVVWYGSIQKTTCVQCTPCSLIYVLETVRTEEGPAEISSDYDENVVDILGEDKNVNPETSNRDSYQNLEKMRQSTARSGFSIIIIIYKPTSDDQDRCRGIGLAGPWWRTLPTWQRQAWMTGCAARAIFRSDRR